MIRLLIEIGDEQRELDTLPDDATPAELSAKLRLVAFRFDTFSALRDAVGDVFADIELDGGEAA